MSTVLQWRPEVLSAAADALAAARSQLTALDLDVEASRPPSAWRGEAAAAARTRFGALDADYLDHVAEVTAVVTALDDAASAITRAQADIESASDAVRRHGWDVVVFGDAVTCTPSADTPGSGIFALVEPAVIAPLARQVADGIAAARDADAALAAVLRSVAADAIDTTATSASQAALPPHLQGITTPDLVDLALEEPAAVAPWAELMTPAQRQAVTDRLAQENLALVQLDPDAGDLEALEHHADHVVQVAAATEAFAADPEIAAGVLRAMGAVGFLDSQLTTRSWSTSLGDVGAGDPLASHQEAMSALLAAGAPADDAWSNALVAHAAATTYAADAGTASVQGLQVLGPLLAGEEHSPHLLATAGEAVVTYERAHLATHGGEPHPWDGDGTWRTDHVAAAGPGGDAVTGSDPLLGILDGMAHSPEAAAAFVLDLAPETPPRGGHQDFATIDRSDLAYLLQDRAWPGQPDGSLLGHETLREALVSAVTPDPQWVPGPDGPAAAPGTRAAEAVITTAGNDVAHARSASAPLTSAYAEILSTYVNDAFAAMAPSAANNAGDLPIGWLNPPWGRADFTYGALDALVPRIGADADAGALLAQQSRAYAETGMLLDLAGAEDLDPVTWAGAVDQAGTSYVAPLGQITEWLREGHAEGAFADQERADAAANDPGLSQALEHGTGYGLTIAAGEAADLATERWGIAGPLSGVLGDALNAGVDWTVAEVFEGPAPVDTSSATYVGNAEHAAYLRSQNNLVIDNAVYQSVPLAEVPAELRRPDGSRIPLAEMTPEQYDVWRTHAFQGSPGWAHAAEELMELSQSQRVEGGGDR